MFPGLLTGSSCSKQAFADSFLSPMPADSKPHGIPFPDSLKTVFLVWEKGRLPFNLVLLALGLAWSWPLQATMKEEAWFGYWGSVFAYGLTANVFYTLGPAFEAYLLAFAGRSLGRWRWLVYGLGLLMSIGMTRVFVWSVDILYIVLYPTRG